MKTFFCGVLSAFVIMTFVTNPEIGSHVIDKTVKVSKSVYNGSYTFMRDLLVPQVKKAQTIANQKRNELKNFKLTKTNLQKKFLVKPTYTEKPLIKTPSPEKVVVQKQPLKDEINEVIEKHYREVSSRPKQPSQPSKKYNTFTYSKEKTLNKGSVSYHQPIPKTKISIVSE